MYANKLKHHNRLFTTIRGVVAYLMLMGVWFFYPHIQRPESKLAEARIKAYSNDMAEATANGDQTSFRKVPSPNHQEEKLVKAHPMRKFSEVVSSEFGDAGLIKWSAEDVSTFNEIDKINLKSSKFVTENDR